MISSILPKTKMNFVKSSNFYGSLKLVKRHFLWTTSVATRSLKRVNFVTSSEVLVKTTCKFTVDHIHILRLFALVKKMVNSCVAANCTNKACLSSGISLHTIPYYNDDRPEAKRRRKIWVDFVKAKRVFEPSKASTLCSIHFLPEDYERRFSSLPNQTKPNHPRLKRDDLGICVYPSIHAVATKHASEPDTQSPRDRRMFIKAITEESTCHGEVEGSKMDVVTKRTPKSTAQRKKRKQELGPQELEMLGESHPDEPVNILTTDTDTQMPNLNADLETIFEKNRRLKNQIITLQTIAQEKKIKMKQMKRKVNKLERLLEQKSVSEKESEKEETEMEEVTESETDDEEAMEDESETKDPAYEVEEAEVDSEAEEEEIEEESLGLLQVDGNLRTEPKHIVFLSQLLLLFNFCHCCKTDNPLVEAKGVGTEAVVTTTCNNPKCPQKTTIWHSQPRMPGRKTPAGNFLLCMAVLLGGGSYTKLRQIFLHMGLGCISHNTYFHYQRTVLFPTIYLHWKKYQAMLMEKAKQVKDGVVIAGDGRHDSMGHSAKFCAYTIFCCTFAQIIHFNLVQRNQAGSSPAMEFMSFKLCMDYMIAYGLTITTFISDRHTSIAKHMRTVLKNIVHYFDIWHLKKKIRKVLSKIAKEKDCEAVNEWIKPCENHLHWSATSTFRGNGLVIWAKFKSFLRHIVNIHSGHSDPLFDKCAHGSDIEARKWLTIDSPLHKKVCTALTNTRLMKGIKKASPLAQTSCLEGFHSVLNHFAPKMIAYCYVGQYCRLET
ncbi:PREDICTED: uncharacterized protein LOC107331715 isoform X3 [Paramuricea clavata]|uniref:PREDICTED: uncharacterized protein LOC107331715 isoform X3 n=3 Tax=Paramuricea clavata TaxID=317549 RepID=A0A7D9JCZ9_PARCT|nr:PREDICTED: uncharacterized protein LOC107331715 isoform X3 [Paramuricea clavata]